MSFKTRSEFAAMSHPPRPETEYDDWRREVIAHQQPSWWAVIQFVALCALIVLVSAPIWLPALDQMFAFYGN